MKSLSETLNEALNEAKSYAPSYKFMFDMKFISRIGFDQKQIAIVKKYFNTAKVYQIPVNAERKYWDKLDAFIKANYVELKKEGDFIIYGPKNKGDETRVLYDTTDKSYYLNTTLWA